MVEADTLAPLAAQLGQDLGCSGWVLVDQAMIDGFAQPAGARNRHHVDPERAAHELPGGKTLAHGLLTVSLVAGLASQIVVVRRHGRAFNHGFNKVRCPSPVPAGARIRLRMKVLVDEMLSLIVH